MKLAFYYHISAFVEANSSQISLPGYIGVFLDSLADEVDELVLVLHQTDVKTSAEDYLLKANNIRFISLGNKTSTWHRVLNHGTFLKNLQDRILECDYLLVRSPSPLAPYFSRYLEHTKLFFLVVGSYKEGAKHLPIHSLRDIIVKGFTLWLDWKFSRTLKSNHVIVNSKQLKERYKGHVKSLSEVKTTTLSSTGFYRREDTCQGDEIHLLYTGRLDLAKGLMELVNAFAILIDNKINVKLHFVGWEDDPNKPVEVALRKRISELNLKNKVQFHGKKKVGVELNAMYQMADIYLIPSYHEGFPRTIWEALANSLPVIATNVGSIPHFLTHKENVYLIKPKSSRDIELAIKEVVDNNQLRKRMIKQGLKVAEDATLEVNSKKIIEIFKSDKI